jgi:cellulose synthase/poly-beta-1,6-N-acetylglucosamine synthase-like glycosyltransferase
MSRKEIFGLSLVYFFLLFGIFLVFLGTGILNAVLLTATYAMMLSGYLILFFGMFLMFISIFNVLKVRTYRFDENYRPAFSLVVPAHNEEQVIERTIRKFLRTRYPEDKKEMIVINDGSADKTKEIVSRYASRIVNADTKQMTYNRVPFKGITLVNRESGGHGKAYALNEGMKYAKGEIFFFTDADVQLSRNAFLRAARHFGDKRVGAVAGYVKVEGKKSFLNKLLDFEYVTGQKILRRGFNVLGVHYIVPGGCAIIRREVLDKVGEYKADTLAEDTDMSWRIMTDTTRQIHFDPSIVVSADEPTSLISLWNQRVRWTRGNIEVTWKNRDKVGKKRYGHGLTWVYPFWISSMILPAAFILSACGLILATTFNISLLLLPFFGKFLGVMFYFSWIVGVILNRGKSWLAGLMTPGIPLLLSLTTMFAWDNGISGLMNYIGLTQFSTITGLIIGMWVLIAIPGTYLCIRIARNHPRLGSALQIGVFGYWMLLIAGIFQGYVAEFMKKDRVWIRTVR